ncbi:LrgB family protein [Rhizobium puerariae]|uniref:LrgB family protein n=1 Tax=Rhizobium puerariae TaxID=1585791 RepID=A0ABV6APL0_9HYPH
MSLQADLWVYLSASPLLWLTVTVGIWICADHLSERLHRHPLANPVLISIVAVVLLLSALEVDYARFFQGAQFVHFALGPATVALAVPFVRHWDHVRELWLPIVVSLTCGSLFAVISVVALSELLGLPRDILISFMPKSATAGVAMAVSKDLGGNVSMTAVLVILTGIVGAIIVAPLMNGLGIKDYAARGFALGLASHGIGTARAYSVSELAGVFASVGMALNAIATSMIVPLLAALLL